MKKAVKGFVLWFLSRKAHSPIHNGIVPLQSGWLASCWQDGMLNKACRWTEPSNPKNHMGTLIRLCRWISLLPLSIHGGWKSAVWPQLVTGCWNQANDMWYQNNLYLDCHLQISCMRHAGHSSNYIYHQSSDFCMKYYFAAAETAHWTFDVIESCAIG